jgi:hypothetical protein
VSAEQVALIAECAECDARWLPDDEERWSAYLTDDERVRGLLDSYDLATSNGQRSRATTAEPSLPTTAPLGPSSSIDRRRHLVRRARSLVI